MNKANAFVAMCFGAAMIMAQSSIAGDIKCFLLQPPEQPLLGIQKIAVLDFSGESGRILADCMVAELLESGRGITMVRTGLFGKKEGVSYLGGVRTDIYTLIERSRIEQVLREQAFGATGAVDENQAAALGKLLGVDAMIIGQVTPAVNNATSREEWTYYKDKQKYTKVVDCLTRTVTVQARMRIIEVNTGRILGTKDGSTKRDDKKCAEEYNQVTSAEVMIADCLRSIGNELVDYFCPRFELVKMELKDIKVKEYKKLADEAEKTVEAGDLDKAYLLYAAILQDDSYNDAALYNQGAINEAVGNFEEARAAYQNALAIRQDKAYNKALERVSKVVSYWPILAALGVSMQKHSFQISEAQLVSAKVAKVRLKGSEEDRILLKQAPDEAGPLVVKVPGGIEMEVLEIVGDWVKVKTFDGKVGYVNRKDTKN